MTLSKNFLVLRDFEMENIKNNVTELTETKLDNAPKIKEKKSDFNQDDYETIFPAF
jgi:hypothetical protein